METSATGPFDEPWRRYRRWYRTSLALQVGFLPIMATIGSLVPVTYRTPVMIGLFLAYTGAGMTCSIVARLWLCPQCGERFFSSRFHSIQLPMAWIHSCGWCDLPKYASGPTRAA